MCISAKLHSLSRTHGLPHESIFFHERDVIDTMLRLSEILTVDVHVTRFTENMSHCGIMTARQNSKTIKYTYVVTSVREEVIVIKILGIKTSKMEAHEDVDELCTPKQ